ncbi:cytosolic 5'-nucleotidase 1B isoform X3 [Canis lupus baileyi]|uniref:cytosolic 5'-nucleotidase 1B isoform X3 n=1 Tax=Canis lupus familiaris TaxID=9615 RepID=UPI00022564A7|nr:cytosolic 5'-nucleotidase 1B isoform X3 [Canis lupus familiaris]XP_038546704.1 cytosolic 5'-nucleotidase 1B isoform X3 [Canis lupus familiaris]|eukprot:XP_003639621.1 cytosolic 5'-nucleotidase 1B isoform X3 [Canis lupus familiaris]
MSQTSLKQKKKNETGSKNSKDSIDTEKRKDSDKSGVRLSTQGSQELSLPKTDSRGLLVRNQWSRTSRSPSTRGPSIDEPRSKSTSLKLPNSSTTSRTSSASPSQHESPEQLSEQASPPTPPLPSTPPMPLDSRPPTPPEPHSSSRRSTRMQENPEAWAHGIVRDIRDSRESSQLRDYPRTPPTEWKSYSQRRSTYSSQLDRDCLSELPQPPRQHQREEEEEEEEAYWASVKTLYEKIPSCSRPRPPKPKNAITIAVSSRALFNMMDGRKIYEEEGLEKYMEYQLNNENVILTPGPAFRFVKALQHVNARLRELYPNEQDLFDIVLMTNNHAQVGVRLINSVNHYGLLIDRFCLTGGKSPIGYLKAYLTNLYLSADSEKVQEAIQEGIASATMFDGAKDMAYCDTQLRVAFDGDAVLFSDESEHIAKEYGLDKFFQHETLFENKPLAQGPLKGFLEDLGRLQKKFYAKDERLLCPIRTYLVTARSAASSGARVLKTLRRWGLEIDEALFLAGAPKGPILVKIRPHIFFDDHMFHIEGAQKLGTISAHVPYGINQK